MPPDAQRASAAPTEAALLACEAAQARAALQAAINDLKKSLGTAADPRVWTQNHPWAGVGVAAAAGFAAAALLKETAAEAVASEPAAAVDGTTAAAKSAANTQSGHSALRALLNPIWEVAKSALETFAVNAVKISMGSPPSEDFQSAAAGASPYAADDDLRDDGLHPRAD